MNNSNHHIDSSTSSTSSTSTASTANPNIQEDSLELMEIRLSAIPGQPSIVYWDSSTDTVVSICPTPQVGLITSLLDHLNFAVTCHRAKGEMTVDMAVDYVRQALDLIDVSELGSDLSRDQLTYKLAVNSEPVKSDKGIGFRIVICVPVTPEVLRMNTHLATVQATAANLIQDIIAVDSTIATKH